MDEDDLVRSKPVGGEGRLGGRAPRMFEENALTGSVVVKAPSSCGAEVRPSWLLKD